ncbi:MAG TPA: hypothetical protein DDX92_10150 [Flavobacteriales bacterium]|jgi:hypothetical protein|nr:hypothetical protein [Flavobacteriales bacterium]
MESVPKYIGNTKSKELHIADCYTVRNMYHSNQRPFQDINQAVLAGYDFCGHCLPQYGIDTNEPKEASYFFGHFYAKTSINAPQTINNTELEPGCSIELFVSLHQNVFEDGQWMLQPVSHHKVDVLSNRMDFETKKTGDDGIAHWTPSLSEQASPGNINFQAETNIGKDLIWGTQNRGTLNFSVPNEIKFSEGQRLEFDHETRIHFQLLKRKTIQADVFRGHTENEFTHIKELRRFEDGPLPEGEHFLFWDGTTEHDPEKHKQVDRGVYKIVLQGTKGDRDRAARYLYKKKGSVLVDEPEVVDPLISHITFGTNPFSNKSKTTIRFTLAKKAMVNIHIQHRNWRFKGDCLKELVRNKTFEAGSHSVTWNGTNNAGGQVSLGAYKIRIKANDQQWIKGGLWKKAVWNVD